MVSQNQLWLQYMQSLSEKISLQSGEALQLVYPYITWDWGGRDPLAGVFSYDEWMALNVVPSNPMQDSNSSAAASQSGFDRAYNNWFNTLAIGDLQNDSHYNDLMDDHTKSLNKYQTDYADAKILWQNQTGGTGPTFAAWLADPAQYGVNSQIVEDQDDLDAKNAELNNYRNQIVSPVKGIQDAYNDSSYQGGVLDPNSSKNISARLWTTDPINAYKHVDTITGGHFGMDAKNGNSEEINFSASTQQYNYQEVYGEAAGSIFADFITVEAEGSYNQIQWSSFSDQYSVKIQWQDMSTVTISPEPWYVGADVSSYSEGPYADGFSQYQTGSTNYFFGNGGALSRIYTKMIVGYRPTIVIEASSSFSDYLYQQWQTETGIMIGPFFFEGEAKGGSQQSTASVSGGVLTITSLSDWPLIVGMVSAWTAPPQS